MLYNHVDPHDDVRARSSTMSLGDADIRELELLRARRSLAYLKDKIGNDGMLELLAPDLEEARAEVALWVEESHGQWRSGALTLRVPGPPAAQFHDWFMSNMKRRNEPLFRAGHPDHFMNHPLPTGRAEVIENVGEDDRPWHIMLTFFGTDQTFPTSWDPAYPHESSFGVLIFDTEERQIGSAMHELRDVSDGSLEAKLSVHLPRAAPAALVEGHLRHFAIEFRNWTEMAAHGMGALQID